MQFEHEDEDALTYSRDCQQIEDLRAIFPSVCITVFLLALIVKTVDLCNLSGLVITAQQCDFVGPSMCLIS